MLFRALSLGKQLAVMQDMRMEGVPSAYGYLVDSDGTMLYHPTADKIGKAVENEVVKGVVSQLQEIWQ